MITIIEQGQFTRLIFDFWEFDNKFKDNLIDERVLAVEMETAALFTICFVSKVNIGALFWSLIVR